MAIQDSVNNIKFKYADFLTLIPEASSQVKDIPKPKGATITNGLPAWNVRPLNTKLPLLKGPEGPFVFSRGKLGANLWRSTSQPDFVLTDPNGYEVSFDYDPMHDKHLKKWFKNSKNRESLLKLGLITKELDVKCSVKHYNEYRKYLQFIYSSAVREAVKIKADNLLEKVTFKRAYESLQKEMVKLNKEGDNAKRRKENREKLDALAKLKKQKCERRLRRMVDTTAYLEQRKKENWKNSIERTRIKNEYIQNRIMAAKKLERKRKIQTLKKWHDTDMEKKRKNNEEQLQRTADIARKAKERWQKKVENQKQAIEKEAFLREQRKLQLETSKNERMRKIQARMASLQEKILLQQGQPIVKGVKKRFNAKQKDILNTVREKFLSQMAKHYAEDSETIDSLKDKIQKTLADIRYDLEPYLLIAEAKKRLQNNLDIPEPVSLVITYILEEAIAITVARKLETIMYKVTHRILFALDKLKFPYIERKPSKSKSSKSLAFQSNQVTIQVRKEKSSRVSFRMLRAVQRDEEIDVLSIKKRPPTPVPSIEKITEAALQDQDLEVPITANQIFDDQRKLMESIESLGDWLLKNVDRRVQKAVELYHDKVTRYTRKPVVDSSVFHPLVRLCNVILFGLKDDFLGVLDTIITDVLTDINFRYSDLKVAQFSSKRQF